MEFINNRTSPVFYGYIHLYLCMKYESNTSMHSKRYRPETIFRTEIKGHNSDNNLWILPLIELGLYFMILYLCMKNESNAQNISPGNHFSYGQG